MEKLDRLSKHQVIKKPKKDFFSDDKRLYMNRKMSSNGYSHHDEHEHVHNS